MSSPSALRDSEGQRRVRLGGPLSLEWKLPLAMTGVLVAGLAASLVFTYRTLTLRGEMIVRDRLSHAAREIASTAEASLQQRAAAMRRVARHGDVRQVLRVANGGPPSAADLGAARGALAALVSSPDAPPPAELWDSLGRVVLRMGREAPATERPPLPMFRSADDTTVDFGRLYAAAPRVRFWVVAQVIADGRRVGFVAQVRNVTGGVDPARMLRELMREDVTLYTRNADGSFWASAPGAPAAAPTARDSTSRGISYHRPDVGRRFAEESVIAGTPWLMVLESAEQAMLARPRQTLQALILMSVVITAAGAVLSWVIGRRITKPIVALTAAAERVAEGTYEHRVAGTGGDEIGRLAASFDAMARDVAASREELERRVRDAQAASDDLERANAQLRIAMGDGERARGDAERARAEAERANRAKSDFLAVMSHELRTPLNAIGGYAQLLEMGLHGPVTEAQREALARIERSQAHLLRLINDVLNFARIDAQQVEYEMDDVPVHDTLSELETLVAPQVRACRLEFEYRPCDPHLAVRADRDRLRQLVLNLLSNAIKYTPEGGRMVIESAADQTNVYVSVRDTGIGIPAERLLKIFEPFVQGQRALNRPNEGVGLGLAISRDLARGMGGELTVASEVGKGSTFTVTLARAGRGAPLGSVHHSVRSVTPPDAVSIA